MRGLTVLKLLFLVTTVSTSASERGEWWQVNLAQGPVRGRKDPNEDLYVFYNIPYATAPTGEHKFKAPLPPISWDEPFDAVDEGTICPQAILTPFMPENLKMKENCLITNIYVPNTKEKNLPVLVYIHGGGFQVGYGDWLKAKALVKPKDFIVVTFNYRLGIHGFLCLGTEDVPGNAGIKDQVALLRWVQQNIAAFDGNPKDVTISGYSAGSASVDLIMIAKSAEGLFHKVIPESGANLAVFSLQRDPLQNAKDHAKTLNFTNINDIYALENFYKTLSYDILAADNFMDRSDLPLLFTPCLERDTGKEGFLIESPWSILKRGNYKKVPLLYGFANMEGLFRLRFFDTAKERMNKNFSDFLPDDLKFESADEKKEVADRVKAFYFGDEPIDNNNVLRYVDYFTDIFFGYSSLKAVKLHVAAGHNEVYLYQYSFVDDDTPVVPHTNVRGADHCAQTMAVLDGKNMTYLIEDDEVSEEYKEMKKTIRELWHNFVITGKPVPEGSSLPAWPAVSAEGSPFMSLGRKVELSKALSEEMFLFWDDIYEKYYQEPIPPPNVLPESHTEL